MLVQASALSLSSAPSNLLLFQSRKQCINSYTLMLDQCSLPPSPPPLPPSFPLLLHFFVGLKYTCGKQGSNCRHQAWRKVPFKNISPGFCLFVCFKQSFTYLPRLVQNSSCSTDSFQIYNYPAFRIIGINGLPTMEGLTKCQFCVTTVFHRNLEFSGPYQMKNTKNHQHEKSQVTPTHAQHHQGYTHSHRTDRHGSKC